MLDRTCTNESTPRISGRNSRKMSGPQTLDHPSQFYYHSFNGDGMTFGFENDLPRPITAPGGNRGPLEANSSLGGEASDQAYYERRRLLQKFKHPGKWAV